MLFIFSQYFAIGTIFDTSDRRMSGAIEKKCHVSYYTTSGLALRSRKVVLGLQKDSGAVFLIFSQRACVIESDDRRFSSHK